MDIASTIFTICEKVYRLGELINQILDDVKEQKEHLEEFKSQLVIFETHLSELQEVIDKYEKRQGGSEIMKKTEKNKKTPKEYVLWIKWIDEKTNVITKWMNETGQYKSGNDGFFTRLKTAVKSIKISKEFLNDMKSFAEELKQKNDEFKTKVLIVQTQLLEEITETLQNVWKAQSDDNILKETHESTTWFWITNFKGSPTSVNRKEFIEYLGYTIITFKFDNNDDKKEDAMTLAEKITDLIDKDKNTDISKGELRESIHKMTGDKRTPFEEYLGSMLIKVN
eukprot:TRINITY_DN11794_c1_g1_i1.p1 TRINITY_DN11794_c1_g1~~TRINITY_DN11794_c1_g1_i1.p1  ORF type:complete len:282 (-),score=96.92 TRINITY_DN11794_c1_g1_i1:110-955(-)